MPAWDLAAQAERHRELIGHVLALDPKYRDVVLMRFYEGLPPRAIAARLEVPVDTVRTWYERALARLRSRLDAQYGDREAWCVAFLPVAALVKAKSAAGPAGLATAASSALATHPIRAMVALAALILFLVGWLSISWTSRGSDPRVTASSGGDALDLRDVNDVGLASSAAPASVSSSDPNQASPASAMGPAVDPARPADPFADVDSETFEVAVVDPEGNPVGDLELGWIDGRLYDFHRKAGFCSLATSRPVVYVGKTVRYENDPPSEFLDAWYDEAFRWIIDTQKTFEPDGESPDWEATKAYFALGPEGRAADPFAALGLGEPSRAVTDARGLATVEVAAESEEARGRALDRRRGSFVSLDPEWCVAAWGQRRVVEDDPRSELALTIVVTRAVVLSGHVVDERGNPLADARVAAGRVDLNAMPLPFVFERLPRTVDALARSFSSGRPGYGTRVVKSNDDGSFLLGPVPASSDLFASTGPLTSFRGSARIEAPGSSVSDLRIVIPSRQSKSPRTAPKPERTRLRGLVVDRNGDPVEGAVVQFDRDESKKTGADGRFELRVFSGGDVSSLEESLPLVAVKPGFASGILENFGARLRAETALEAELVVEMGPALSIAGRVVDGGGRSLEGWYVQLDDPTYLGLGALEYTAESVARDPSASIEVETSATGDFLLTGLRDRPYSLLVWDGDTFVSQVTAPIAAGTHDARIVIPDDALRNSFSARVVAPDGSPLPDVEVRVSITLRANAIQARSIRREVARTDATGSFTVDGLPRDRVDLEFSGVHVIPGGKRRIDRSIPDQGHEFVVSRRCRLRLEIDDPPVYVRLLDRDGVELPLLELGHGEEGRSTSTWHGGGYVQESVKHLAVPENARSVVLGRDLDPGSEIIRFEIAPDPRRETVLRH